MPEAEQQVVIEDPSGSKITVARDSRHEVLVTFSGHIIPEDLSEGNQIGTRRTVTNKVLSIRHFDDQKDILSEIIESEEFRDCQREDSELRTFSFALAGNVRCGFEDGQFYIEVHNTKGRRAIIFQELEKVLYGLIEAFIKAEEWFPRYFSASARFHRESRQATWLIR